jgi:hypothetical protein
MSVSLQRVGLLVLTGLSGLALLATPALAAPLKPAAQPLRPTPSQIQPITTNFQSAMGLRFGGINPNPPLYVPPTTLGQYTYNVARLGNAYSNIPPYLLGYNPYVSPVTNYSAGAITPYAVSTVPGGYGGGYGYGGALSTTGGIADPYSLSTTGGNYGGSGSGGYPYYGESPVGGFMRGTADLTAATGKYWKDIQQARIMREQSRQMHLDTEHKRILEEAWYESMRPTAQTMRDREMASDLTRARRDPPLPEVWSGRSLNALLTSINRAGGLNRVPSSPLEEDILKGINLTNGASRGNVGLLKDPSGLNWPLTLKDSAYDEPRKRLNNNLLIAVNAVKKEKSKVDEPTLRTMLNDYQKLNQMLTANVNDLTPSQYIEAKRFLNQLGDALSALQDPNAVSYFSSWSPRGKNVAELVDHMKQNGLQFAPAAPGDENAYTALYFALRNFEAALQSAK